jgi:hypothetical protein
VKKIAAILFAGIFLFNWYGYRLLTSYLQQRADKHLEARLDQHDYDHAQLIEMRVPLNMPYQTLLTTGYERVNGEIEIDGIHYKYVKRKIENGELVLLCLPNQAKMRLESVSNDFFKLVNDLQNPAQNKNQLPGPSSKNPVTEYWQQLNDWSLTAPGGITHAYIRYTTHLPASPVITTPAQPPEC